jgi:hypothetical protein
MNLHVRLEIGSLIEASIADWTFMWRLFQMCDFMNGECARLTESFSTIIALEWLLFGVNITMITKMILTTECFSTNVTRVRTLIGMRSLVNQKIVRLCELTITIFADELLLWSSASRTSNFQWTKPITSCNY